MRKNVFVGNGFFGARELGQRYGYQLRPVTTFHPRLSPASVTPSSDVDCYFCPGLPGAPTYWLSGFQAQQWNDMRDAHCTKIDSSECREKFARARTPRLPRSGFGPFNLPGGGGMVSMRPSFGPGTTSTSIMSGIPVENPELLG